MVFINDGATWIENFIQANYPKVTDILDFFHAAEYLHDFSKVAYSRKTQIKKRGEWGDKQVGRLLNDEVAQVIVEIEQMDLKGKKKQEATKCNHKKYQWWSLPKKL